MQIVAPHYVVFFFPSSFFQPHLLFVCSVTVRPAAAVAAVAAGDDGLGKQEHASSVRLPGMEHGPLDASTPQLEDLPSPLGSQSAANMVF